MSTNQPPRSGKWARRLLPAFLLAAGLVPNATPWLNPAWADPPPEPSDDPTPPLPLPYPTESHLIATEPVGYLPGGGSVSATGEYTYALPLDVPAGRAGMAPDLSVTYGHRGGAGLLGVGFSLQGLSSVSRCSKTVQSDGFADGVDFDATDAFCWNGLRMRPVNGVPNGADGAEYRTDDETFTRVVSYGDDGLGPSLFRAWTRDGHVLDYQPVSAMRVLGGPVSGLTTPEEMGDVRFVWLLATEKDRYGNVVKYHYDVDHETEFPYAVEYHLSEIEYTAKEGGDEGRRKVTFDYVDRPDTGFVYESGVRTKSTKLLWRVNMLAPEVPGGPIGLAWQYTFNYLSSLVTSRSLLATITKTDRDGVGLWNKTFEWADGAKPQFEEVVFPIQGGPGALDVFTLQVLDANGDGKDDVLQETGFWATNAPAFHFLNLSTEDSTGVHPLSEQHFIPVDDPSFHNVIVPFSRPLDQDGDGTVELFAARGRWHLDDPPAGYQLLHWDQEKLQFLPVGPFLETPTEGLAAHLLDLDGDGRLDLVREQPTGEESPSFWHIHQGVGPSSWSPAFGDPGAATPFVAHWAYEARAADLDGDGRSGLFTKSWANSAGAVLGLDDNGAPLLDPRWGVSPYSQHALLDVNGDGLKDVLSFDGGTEAFLWINTGNGFVHAEDVHVPQGLPPPEEGDSGIRTADFDRDGREDLMTVSDKTEPTPATETEPEMPAAPGIRVHLTRGATMTSVVASANPGYKSANNAGWTNQRLGDFNGDGLVDIAFFTQDVNVDTSTDPPTETISNQIHVLLQSRDPSDVITSVWDEDALAPREEVVYERKASAGSTCAYPQRCIRHAMEVVTEHRVNPQPPQTGVRRRQYTYEDPRLDMRGGGFLGYGKVRVFDPDNFSESTTAYDLDTNENGYFYRAGRSARVTTITPILEEPIAEGTPIPVPGPGVAVKAAVSDTVYYHEAQFFDKHRHTVRPYHEVAKTFEQDVHVTPHGVTLLGDPDEGTIVERTSGRSFDAWDNVVYEHSWVKDGSYHVEEHTFENREDEWLLGLRTRSEVWHGTVDELGPSRIVTWTYDEQGSVREQNVMPDDPALRSGAIFTRDDAGLVTKIREHAANAAPRTLYFDYDDEGVFVVSQWNALGHATRAAVEPSLGAPLVIEDANGAEVHLFYDGFGRQRISMPDAGQTTWISYAADDRHSPGHPSGLAITTEGQDGGVRVSYTDDRGRPFQTIETGFQGAPVHRKIGYNLFGRRTVVTRARENAPGLIATHTTYDTLGRVVEVAPDGLPITRFNHTKFETTRFDANFHQSRIEHDLEGRPTQSLDVMGDGDVYYTSYFYGPFGQMTEVVDAANQARVIGYDALGRRTQLLDPDLGQATWTYNGFGETLSETKTGVNGATRVRTYERDLLGRVIRTVDIEDGATPEVTTFNYDDGAGAIGKLSSSISPDGVETAFAFDALGRPHKTSWTIGTSTFEVEQCFDTMGRVSHVLYPEAPNAAGRFGTSHVYNPWGFATEVRRANKASCADATPEDPSAEVYWHVTGRDADGALTAAERSNGVTESREYNPASGRLEHLTTSGPAPFDVAFGYDGKGNLLSRADQALGRTETYTYDATDRLETWNLTWTGSGGSTGGQRLTAYEYGRTGNLTKVREDGLVVEENTYGQSGYFPHALTGRTVGGNTDVYGVDEWGRQVTGPGRLIAYTPFDLPRTIAGGGAETTFSYDAAGARVRKLRNEDGVLTDTITLGGLYERRETPSGIEHVFYVQAEGGTIAEVVFDEGTTEEETRHLTRDLIGSVSLATGKNGALVERTLFDPFGRRVDEEGLTTSTLPEVPLGFTGHRHDDELGLIDMKGRIYDPVLRRFLTPDPIVGDVLYGQSFNRYSYVLNNPLRFVDPTGFTLDEWLEGLRSNGMPGASETGEEIVDVAANTDKMVLRKVKRKPDGAEAATPGDSTPVAGTEVSDSAGFVPGTGATAQPKLRPAAQAARAAVQHSPGIHPVIRAVLADLAEQGTQAVLDGAEAVQNGDEVQLANAADRVVSAIRKPVQGPLTAAMTIRGNLELARFGADEGQRMEGAIGALEDGMTLVGAALGVYGTIKGKISAGGASPVARSPSGKRLGDFTPSQKASARAENAKLNGGQMACTDCGRPLDTIKSAKGTPTPPNQAQIHHDPPIVEGGGRDSTAVVLCPGCHKMRHANE